MHNKTRTGFTIVELLIVIVVIAILAALTVASYSGIQRQAANATIQSSLKTAATKFKTEHAATDTYPTTFPNTITTPPHIGFALTVVSTASQFCVNATHASYADMQWNINQDFQLREGLCPGAVITGSIIGDYRAASTPQTPVVTVNSTGGGFKLTTNDTWTTITLSWDAVPGAARYEIQTKESDESTWYCRMTSNGSSAVPGCAGNGALSYNIAASTTSLSWTNIAIRPKSSAVGHDYRLRSIDGSGNASAWNTLSLTPLPTNQLTKLPHFTVTPEANWGSVTLDWGDVSANNIPDSNIEVQTKASTSDTWIYQYKSDGRNGSDIQGNGAFSYTIPTSTTSINWTSAHIRPAAVDTSHEYRARIRSGTIPGMNSEWSHFTLNHPSVSQMNKVRAFSVVAAENWASVTLSWSIDQSTDLPSPTVEIQTKISTEETWYCRMISNGSGAASGCTGNGALSYNIPVSTTSLTWSNAAARPAAGQTHEYRIRVRSGAVTGLYGDWQTASLSR